MLEVTVDYSSATATIGTKPGEAVPTAAVIESIESLGYQGRQVAR